MRLRGRPISITDDSLLDAARDVFLSRGLEATTQEIARRARISESVIFYRYKTKEALFAAVFERQIVLPEAFARLAEAAGKSTLAAHLLDAGRGVVTMMSAMMPFMMMAFSSPVKLSMVHERTRQPHPVMGEMIERLATYFKAEARLGRLRKVNAEVLAWTFLGSVSHFVWMQSCLGATDVTATTTRFLRGMIALLLQGAGRSDGARKGQRAHE